MLNLILERLNWRPTRDNNYYSGLLLLTLGVLSIGLYLLLDLFEPLSFLVTFLICGWGFVLLWKSDNDLRFQKLQEEINDLQEEIAFLKRLI